MSISIPFLGHGGSNNDNDQSPSLSTGTSLILVDGDSGMVVINASRLAKPVYANPIKTYRLIYSSDLLQPQSSHPHTFKR
jgi:hypothetical protein